MGYTPGYLWSYPWHGCPFYGSGWYYPPFWGPVYYPRPVTYGMHVSYNPWTGWNFGFSYSNGFMTIGAGFGWGHGGYYRPGYPPGFHRPPCFYPPGGHHPPYYPPGHRPGRPIPTPYSNRPNAGRPSQLPASANLYRKDAAQNRLAPSTLQRDANLQKADRAAKGPNNVFADRDGNVFRQNPKGWDARDQGQWKPTLQPAQPAQPSSPATRPVQQPTPPLPVRASNLPGHRCSRHNLRCGRHNHPSVLLRRPV